MKIRPDVLAQANSCASGNRLI